MTAERLGENAQLALDTIYQKSVKEIPSGFLLVMEHAMIERLAGTEPGSYVKEPEKTYLGMLKNVGTCLCDQYIPTNPLSMGAHGYQGKEKTATTGAEEVRLNDMLIDSPEAVVEHMEKFIFPAFEKDIPTFDEDAKVAQILEKERNIQEELGPNILKSGYAFIKFPCLRYGAYGYANYLMAYALYPEVMEKDFSLQADMALLNNTAAARACKEGNLPPMYRLDHDMADSKHTLVSIDSLDRIWFPHFARCLAPMLKTDVRLIWHCDGNLMDMVPRLLDVGLKGFQGFQYEDGMDYEKICAMKTRDGEDLIIWGGVSVTRTLPMGTPADVKKEIEWLVQNGPETGFFLAGSSSITPGVSWENLETLVEGFEHYRKHGRNGS